MFKSKHTEWFLFVMFLFTHFYIFNLERIFYFNKHISNA